MTRVFAHRGAAQSAPENSLEAFSSAAALGADGVELDVRRTIDGALVVAHDASIAGLGSISQLELAELPAQVTLLSSALELCVPMTVNVEIKNSPAEPGHDPSGSLVDQVLTVIVELDLRDDVLISSFDLATLEAVRRLDGQIEIGLLVEPGAELSEALEIVTDSGFDALHPFVLGLDQDLVDACQSRGIAVNTWTVNAEHDLRAMVEIGVDAVITDDVALARRVVDGSSSG